MLHQCNVSCRTIDVSQAEMLGIEDPLKWLPFIIDLSQVYAAKLTTDNVEEMTFNCTTLFTYDSDAYVIDTPFQEFQKIFINYKTNKNGNISDTGSNSSNQGTGFELS